MISGHYDELPYLALGVVGVASYKVHVVTDGGTWAMFLGPIPCLTYEMPYT